MSRSFIGVQLLLVSLLLTLGAAPCVASAAPTARPVTLAWDPNPEPDITGYVIRYGSATGDYQYTIEWGAEPTVTLHGLVAGELYFCAVSARNTAGLESPPSNEVSFRPQTATPIVVTGVTDGEALNAGSPVSLSITAVAESARVELFENGLRIDSSPNETLSATWNPAVEGARTLEVRGYNTRGELVHSKQVPVNVIKPKASVSRRRSDGAFEITITGAKGRTQHVYASEDLTNWTRIGSKTNESGEMTYVDEEAKTRTRRFYRVASE